MHGIFEQGRCFCISSAILVIVVETAVILALAVIACMALNVVIIVFTTITGLMRILSVR
jgi:hypothetical protein